MRKKELDYLHPAALYIYFAAVFSFSLVSGHPVFCTVSFIGAAVLGIFIKGFREAVSELLKLLAFMPFITFINPLITHLGATPLFFINDSPYTLEALVCGFFIWLLMASVLMWATCFTRINNSEKTLYIASHFSETMSVILSMSLRFIPMMKEKMTEIKNARKAMGLYRCDTPFDAVKSNLDLVSVLLTFFIENSADTAMSMKARGFGTAKRRSYSIYRMRRKDVLVIIISVLFLAVIFVQAFSGTSGYNWYPVPDKIGTDIKSIVMYILSAVFSLIPSLIELKGVAAWRLSEQKT